jgi:hypothetical protein
MPFTVTKIIIKALEPVRKLQATTQLLNLISFRNKIIEKPVPMLNCFPVSTARSVFILRTEGSSLHKQEQQYQIC